MKRISYDYVFITHLPAFYKVNLYNELARHLNIFVIFIASSSSIRTKDFVSDSIHFDYESLYHGDFESRPILSCAGKLILLLLQLKFSLLIVGGWDLCEFWVAVLMNSKRKNALVLESTIMESSTAGMRLTIKKFFISRIGKAFPSGKLHQQLLDSLGFNGVSYPTGGVGVFNRVYYAELPKKFTSSFLYVGRLSSEKNLSFLVEIFNSLPNLKLTVVGSGSLEGQLKGMACGNITFISHVPNPEIGNIYLSHDILVLPSLREPWGLVVDEALHYGLPVLVSRHVGCHTELVEEGITGFTFDPDNKESLLQALHQISSPSVYNQMKQNVRDVDFSKRDADQIMAYVGVFGKKHLQERFT